ncbi:MAG: endoglucanase [Cellulomonas sp. 73-145]|uniref:glycoside hydrolase family 5 protein n=1 Tax=Cellulomonas sp. 73-145 TaxID=1895739 RepID=UPI000926DF84|nr:cellulase family glycosylhydrolase [Cellulomonas sp. 73-145]OJV59132.1 MAG: endoglucanase [Cellulomonas sp. 73-145]
MSTIAAGGVSTTTGFVHVEDGQIVDGAGRPLLLRGVALGGWLLPEGYMWRLGDGAQSPREIEALVARLVGRAGAADFWAAYRDAFVTEADIARIAASGLDHVRVPINSRVVQDETGEPIEAGYALLDRVIGWCRTHGLRVLLDLHGAPGGQTGTNIDDSPRGLPELFLEPRYRELTLRLWHDLASRYADEPTVLGYDLLNEPLPNEWQHQLADQLVALYRDLTATVREVDQVHLIQYEGSHWATNFTAFTQRWDDNAVLHFHKYWSAPDVASIEPYLRVRDQLGLPLYMGEGGENHLDWLYTAFRLYETFGIGWNLWTWKKLDTATSPVSVAPPAGWDRFVASAQGPAQVTGAEAGAVLDELVHNVRFEAADWQPDVLAAVTGERPAVMPAWGYGFRGAGASYSVARPSRFEVVRADDASALTWTGAGPLPENPFTHDLDPAVRPDRDLGVRLAAGDWLEFELTDAGPALPYAPVLLDGGTVTLEPAPRGLRAIARTDATLLRIVRTDDQTDDEAR